MAGETDILAFEGFALDRANRRLTRDGRPVEVGSRYLDALLLLLAEPGALVTKERFMDDVWRGIPVTDEALTQCIRTLRRALGERAGEARFIETVPKHGYRFVAPVAEAVQADGPAGGRAMALTAAAQGGRIAGAATIGGGIAGALGGLLYGALATSGGSSILVMIALVAALGVLGGAGVGLGMGAACAWRGPSAAALIAGGALGGMLVGAIGSVMGADGIAALTGASLPRTTGMFEGLLLGLAVSMGAIPSADRPRQAGATIALAAAAGALAGALIVLAGGALLGSSLLALAAQFPASDISMNRIGGLFGELDFGPLSQAISGALEGATFAACIAAALSFAPIFPANSGR